MRFDSLCLRAPSVLVMAALCLGFAVAQTRNSVSASLEVVVKDPSGALIRNAQVQLIRKGKRESAAPTNDPR